MKASAIYSSIAKSVPLVALAATALIVATTAQARPHYVQDVQYVQISPQLVITPPQLVVQAPVQSVYPRHVYPSHVFPRHVNTQPVVTAPVYVPPQPIYYRTNFILGQIYYVDGRPFLNGHPYYGHGHKRHKVKHFDKHGDKHFGKHHGYGHGHNGGHR